MRKESRSPLQQVQPLAHPTEGQGFCFIADLPAMGYRTYRLVIRETAHAFP